MQALNHFCERCLVYEQRVAMESCSIQRVRVWLMIKIESLDKKTILDMVVTLLFEINQRLGAYNQIGTSWSHYWLEVFGASFPTSYVAIQIFICFKEFTAA